MVVASRLSTLYPRSIRIYNALLEDPLVMRLDPLRRKWDNFFLFLQKSVAQTRAYLRDTKNLLQLLQEIDLTEREEVYLVTADVTSLYTIIQHDDALLALNWALCQRDDITHSQKVFIWNALDFCLGHNYFWYSGNFYSQKRGIVMGAQFASSIANLFMGEWEDKTIFSVKRDQLLLHRRYIDDLFFIWWGSLSSLHEFLEELN